MSEDAALSVDDDHAKGIERVLVVTAHPDDAEFGLAGTVALWTDAAIAVSYLVVTNGDAGAADGATDRNALAELRRTEQVAAAAAVGVSDVSFLGYPDGRLEASPELRRDISRVIRTIRPDRVVCPSPERLWDTLAASHPDHLAAGEATVRSVYPDARNPFSFPELLDEGLEPFSVRELWMMAHPSPNRAVDVTETFARKASALRSHVSQIGAGEWIEERLGARLAAQAERAGLGRGRFAELFKVVIAP